MNRNIYIETIKPPTRYNFLSQAEVLDKSLDVYKKSFGSQVLSKIIMSIVAQGVSFVFLTLTLGLSPDFLTYDLSTDMPIMSWLPFLFVYQLFMTFLKTIQSTFNISYARDTFVEQKNKTGFHIKRFFTSLPHVISLILVRTIISLPLVIAIFYAYIQLIEFTASTFTLTRLVVLSVLIIIIALLLWVIPSFIFDLANVIAVIEKKFCFAALKKTFHIAKGKIISSALMFALYHLTIFTVIFALFAGAGALFGFLSAMTTVELAAGFSVFGVVVLMMFTVVLSFLAEPMSSILLTVHVLNFKGRRDGLRAHMLVDYLNANHTLETELAEEKAYFDEIRRIEKQRADVYGVSKEEYKNMREDPTFREQEDIFTSELKEKAYANNRNIEAINREIDIEVIKKDTSNEKEGL